MAVAAHITHPSLSIAPSRLSAIRISPSITLKTLPTHPVFSKSNPGFLKLPSSLSPIPTSSRRFSFRSPTKVAKSNYTIVDGDGDVVSEDNQKRDVDRNHSPTLKTLIQVYKEAICDGDDKTVSDIEAIIRVVESEKNDLVQKVSELSTDIASGKDKFLRLKADFENFRKRFEKDRITLTSDVQGEAIESLLPIVDSFERAKQKTKPETEKEKKIDTSYHGIYKQFVEIMRSLRVSVVETVGKPFDPLLHEAIAREESWEYKEGIIIQELRRGFVLGGQLLRPARVKVSAGPGPKKAPVSNLKPKEHPTAAARTDIGTAANR